ncbi:MAG: DciA family protein [Geitlerinemataceae cyanobacterium]
MEFDPLAKIVDRLRPSFRSPAQQQLDAIVAIWCETFGASLADRARPIQYERGILTIAVRQSIWAQQLAAQTHPLLEQLCPHLPPEIAIASLRFRVAPHRLGPSAPQTEAREPGPHPSRWPNPDAPPKKQPNSQPKNQPDNQQKKPASLAPRQPPAPPETNSLDRLTERWSRRLDRPDSRPCPRCQCPTPPGELDRWSMCAPCAIALFQTSMALGCQRAPFQELPDTSENEPEDKA